MILLGLIAHLFSTGTAAIRIMPAAASACRLPDAAEFVLDHEYWSGDAPVEEALFFFRSEDQDQLWIHGEPPVLAAVMGRRYSRRRACRILTRRFLEWRRMASGRTRVRSRGELAPQD